MLKESWEILYLLIDIDSQGEMLEKEEVFGSIEAVKTVSDLFMPISGEVLAFNEKLEDHLEFIHLDPYYRFYFSEEDEILDYRSCIEDTQKEIKRFNEDDAESL